MMDTEYSNTNVKLLVLTRPGDVLRTLLQSFAHLGEYDFTFCETLYDVTEQLHTLEADCTVFLIGRPAMLANPSFLALCKKRNRLRLVGWVSPGENPADKAFRLTAEAGLIMVSSLKQLEQVLEALRQTVARQMVRDTESKSSSAGMIRKQDYRLSNEELDALLGAG
ncbi:MAG: hypothetical protein ACYTET_06330 [Planctomycetota bacterium]